MTFLEKISTIDRLDQLIRMKATGAPDELANKLGVSRRTVFDIINTMKKMDAPIGFCKHRKTYYYQYECKLFIGFIENNNNKSSLL